LVWLAALLGASALWRASEDLGGLRTSAAARSPAVPRAGESITWSGECKNGFAHGEGVLQWYLNGKEDDRYEGNLELGWAEGRGVLYRGDGGKYDGEWKDSLQQGNGRYEAPDGSWYEDQWKMNKPRPGQYRQWKVFIGEWIDGVYEGDIELGRKKPTIPTAPER
jgi:hypothetical protein